MVRYALDTGRPAVVAELKEAGHMLDARRAHLALRILDCGLGGATHLGAMALPCFCTSNSVRFSPV